jgi:hypothetical protein
MNHNTTKTNLEWHHVNENGFIFSHPAAVGCINLSLILWYITYKADIETVK